MRNKVAIQPAYGRVRDAALYAGTGERTLREWLNGGLPHIRVRGGNILIKFAELDEWLARWRTSADQAGAVVNELFNEVSANA